MPNPVVPKKNPHLGFMISILLGTLGADIIRYHIHNQSDHERMWSKNGAFELTYFLTYSQAH
eukprot:3018342-Amphidinium_carterae.1